MIIGLGTDIVEVSRVSEVRKRHDGAFERKVYTLAERAKGLEKKKGADHFFAGRWAAKEAIVKALGTGFGPECGWQDIEILNDDRGRPILTLSGQGAAYALSLGIKTWHITISHEKHYPSAVAIVEG